jgi:hypothetical protein
MAEGYRIEKTAFTPGVEFDPAAGFLRLEGESYPENAAAFYLPLFEQLRAAEGPAALKVEITLDYFNSSSSKCLLDLVELLNRRVQGGQAVSLAWRHDADDEEMREAGEEFAEDAVFEFTIKPKGNG